MLIACPRCETTFSLQDELYRPGRKARCSLCGNVFPMTLPPDGANGTTTAQSQPASAAAAQSSALSAAGRAGRGKLFFPAMLLLALCCLALFGYGGHLVYRSLTSGNGTAAAVPEPAQVAPGEETPVEDEAEQAERARLVSEVSLEEIRQFLVDNVQSGKLMVIQGFAVNISSGSRDYIAIEARILDGNNRVLDKVRQLCGVPLTLFQLQTLPVDALRETLNSQTAILINNTNIGPGGKVPFVAVFANPPESMRTFEVQVIDVRETPAP